MKKSIKLTFALIGIVLSVSCSDNCMRCAVDMGQDHVQVCREEFPTEESYQNAINSYWYCE